MVNLVQRGQDLGKEGFLSELTNGKIHVFTALLKSFYLSFCNHLFQKQSIFIEFNEGTSFGVPFLLLLLFDFKEACI